MPGGSIRVNGQSKGLGFALSPGVVVTANHVVRGQDASLLTYVTDTGQVVKVDRVDGDEELDVAVLYLSGEVSEFFGVGRAAHGAHWRVEVTPSPRDARLTGVVADVRRPYVNSRGHQTYVMQLLVSEQLQEYAGYSGGPVVIASRPDVATGVLVEELRIRLTSARVVGQDTPATNVLYAVPLAAVIGRFGLNLPIVTALGEWTQTAEQVELRINALTHEFYGRTVELKALDTFLHENSSGLVIVTAPAGAGKSALLAHWVQSRSQQGDFVARHFISASFDLTTTPELAIGHLIAQLSDNEAGETRREAPDRLGQVLHRFLTTPASPTQRRIVVLDGLDEATEIITPFVEAELASDTFVVVSGRSNSALTPPYLQPWIDRAQRGLPVLRLHVAGLDRQEIMTWLSARFPGLVPDELVQHATLLESVSDGLALIISLLLEDAPSEWTKLVAQPSNKLPDVPDASEFLTTYVVSELKRRPQGREPLWDNAVRSTFALLSQALGPLQTSEINRIRGYQYGPVFEEQRFARWLTVTGEIGNEQVSFTHPLLARAFAEALGEEHCSAAREDLTNWALQAWKASPPSMQLVSAFRVRAPYALRWLIPHLLTFENGPQMAADLLLDAEWLESKLSAKLEVEVEREFSRVQALLVRSESPSILELVHEAIRQHLTAIIAVSGEYPQFLIQSVLNSLSPLLTQLSADSQSVSERLLQALRKLISDWTSHARSRAWPWIRVDGVDRQRALLSALVWQDYMQDLPAHLLAFSPSGARVAGAASWHYANRTPAPAPWSHAYDIAFWSTRDGRPSRRLYPDTNAIELDDPPDDVPRPPEVDTAFRDYFEYRKGLRGQDHRARPPAQRPEQKIDETIGRDWFESAVTGDVKALCWLDDRLLLVSTRGGRILLFDVQAGQQQLLVQQSNVDADLEIHDWNDTATLSMIRLRDTAFLAGTSLGSLEVRDHASNFSLAQVLPIQPQRGLRSGWNGVLSLAFHSGAARLAVGLADHSIRIVDISNLREVDQLTGHDDGVVGLAWSPSGDRLASSSYYSYLRVWEVATKRLLFKIHHPLGAMSLAWGPADDQILTTWNESGVGGAIRAWDANTGELLSEFDRGPALIESIAVSREAGVIAIGRQDRSVRVLDPRRKEFLVSPRESHSAVIRGSDFNTVTDELATLSADGIKIWSVGTGEIVRSYAADWSRYVDWGRTVVYSSDGTRLAVTVGRAVYMFEASTLHLMWAGANPGKDVARAFFSIDAQLFLTDDLEMPNEGSGTILWRVVDGTILDRGDRHGLEAEDSFNAYNAKLRVETGFPAPTVWGLGLRKAGVPGVSRFHVYKDHQLPLNLILAGGVRDYFRLAEFGMWAVIFEGATAPSKATVVWPS